VFLRQTENIQSQQLDPAKSSGISKLDITNM